MNKNLGIKFHTKVDKSFFWLNGFIHLKSFFSYSDLDKFEKFCLYIRKNRDLSDPFRINNETLFQFEEFSKFALSSNVISVAEQLLEDKPIFFGETALFYKEPLKKEISVEDFIKNYFSRAGRILHHDAKGSEKDLLHRRTGIQDNKFPGLRFATFFSRS